VEAQRQIDFQDGPACASETLRKALAGSSIAYIALGPPTYPFPLPASRYASYALGVLQSREYGIIAMGEDTVLLKRGADHDTGLRLLTQWSQTPISNEADVEKAYSLWTAVQIRAY
jgi:hypothetical protein